MLSGGAKCGSVLSRRRFALAFVAIGATLHVPVARGQEPPRRTIDEIIVTAQKREQVVTDVPISMSVVDDRFIAQEGLTDLADVSRFAPNVDVQEAGWFVSPRIRGFTVDDRNKAFDPPVTLVLNGIAYTRSPYFQAALFDVERVEVLRGPQGTTFGKNTTAGLISIVSKNPTDEFTGFVDVQLGELDHKRFEAALGGPLIAGLANFRIAGFSDERDGFVKNTTGAVFQGALDEQRGVDRAGLRGKIEFPDVFGSKVQLSYERFDLELLGSGTEMASVTSEATRSFLRGFDPNADFDDANLVSSIDEGDFRRSTIDTFVATASFPLGKWALELVTGHSVLETAFEGDTDTMPAPLALSVIPDRNPTTTAELRVFSPTLDGLFGLGPLAGISLGSTDFLAGIFYERREIEDSVSDFFIDGPNVAILIALENAEGQPSPFPVPPGGMRNPREQLRQDFAQKAEAIAGFGEASWHFVDRWTLQYGMRVSHETKEGAWESSFPQGSAPVIAVAGFEEFTAALERSELEVQPKVSLNYTPTDDVSLFARWSRGFKSGGFNAYAATPDEDQLAFDAESATEWALDAKTTLLDGTMSFNVSLFRMDARDFQVLTVDPQTLFNVTTVENAPKARSQGVEAEWTWLPSDWLTIRSALGFDDTEFIEFPNNNCASDRPNADGDDDPRCDVSGQTLPFAPKWNLTLTPTIVVPIAVIPVLGPLDFVTSPTVEYEDTQFLSSDLDPRSRQGSFFRVGASVGLLNAEKGWSLRVIGENLTDERIRIFDSDTGVGGIRRSFTGPPRLFFGQLRWEW